MRLLSVLFLFCFIVLDAHGMKLGFNQAWLKNSYGHQWTDKSYDSKYAESILKTVSGTQGRIIRMWVFESAPEKLHPELLKNFAHFLDMARKYDVRISLTLFDANAFKKVSGNWSKIFNEEASLRKLQKDLVLPLYDFLKSYTDVVFQIDVMNEINALIPYKVFKNGHQGLLKFMCTLKERSPVPYTASLGWAHAVDELKSGVYYNTCLDYYDIHLYNNEGEIPSCDYFKMMSKRGYKFQLGEFGQKSPSYDDDLQYEVTRKFIANAKDCGFRSALIWRLDDTRAGMNPEARFSLFSFGKLRRAFELFL